MGLLKSNKLIANILATVSGKFGTMGIQLLTTMILSRFLVPEDFGIVAMCSIFLSISEMLIDSGMAGSIIFYKDVEDIELHSLFWTNLLVSVIIYIILFSTSGWIAVFYKIPVLESIIKVIGFSSVIHSLCLIQSALLSKQLKFKIQSKILVYSAICSSVVVVILAFYQAGVWTLVAQPILLKLFQVFFYFIFGSYTPRLKYSLNSLKRHWEFGSRLLASSFLKLIYDNMYVQVIGRIVNLKDAGFYAQAKRFNDIPTNIIIFPLERVIFPALASSDNKVERMKKMASLFTIFVVPLLFLAALLSNNLIFILLGKKWLSSGWILSYMLLGTIGASLEALNRNFIKASGETRILLKYDFFKRIINIIVLIIGTFWSLEGILIAFIVNGFISWGINCIALNKAMNYNIKSQVLEVIVILLVAVIPYSVISIFSKQFMFNIYIDSILKSIFYISIYCFFIFLFKKNDVLNIVANFKKRKNV